MRPNQKPGESSTKKRKKPNESGLPYHSKRIRPAQHTPPSTDANGTPTSMTRLPSGSDCTKCGAKKFTFESKHFCCCDGEVHIANNETPPELINLFCNTDDYARHFRRYVRLYNSLFAFSSLGGHHTTDSKKGIYVFKLLGQIYHYLPDLLPSSNDPKYLQLYFYDAEHEAERRSGVFPELMLEIMSIIMLVMERNPYATFFRSLREFDIVDDTKIIISQNPSLDQRVYNAPTSQEVAAIILDTTTSCPQQNSPHIIVYGKSAISHRVMHYYGCYDPLQYPILYPRGECGWHQGLKRTSTGRTPSYSNPTFPFSSALIQTEEDLISEETEVASRRPPKEGREISCREYYAYKFQIRTYNYLLRSGRLLQQYIVDMYIKIENTRLDYFRRNQSAIRGELYQGILDSLTAGQKNASKIGHKIILPPSFTGGPTDIKRRYLNAMTLVQKYGKPYIFLTITCNPNWPEIKEQLLPEEKVENRPDLVARVFRAKLIMLKAQIIQGEIFGHVVARVDVIEFQKRGLPHAHFLIILKADHKIINPEHYDKIVCAEIPSNENMHLRSVVLKHMMHGPCGEKHPTCACMTERSMRKKCRFNYPKIFSEFTTCGDDSYPIYRRRNTGETVSIRGEKLDNRWVTPYNPKLLAMFDCHMNVEIYSTVKAVKYLYKYVYKGHDRVNFKIVQDSVNNNDEIESFQSGRWISPPEAAWRIFAFDLYDINPPVIPLQIHLPNLHFVSFAAAENLQSVASDEQRLTTMLTQFFEANKNNQEEHKYLYSEFPEHYVWNIQTKTWTRRKQRFAIGRLAYVGPSEGERYHLRLLLSHVRGPTSFQDLLTIDGHTCTTFQEAAEKHGLLEENGYVESCLNEAMQVQMPSTLRRLFATLLIFCEPANPRGLWENYFAALSEDFRHQHKEDAAQALQLTCRQVERHLEGMGKSLKSYKLGDLVDQQDNMIKITRDISDALSAPIPSIYDNGSKLLNNDQRTAYKCIIQHVKDKKPGAFFVDGPGGTGKTFLYCVLYAKVRSMGKIVLPTATSGIAASNIPTERTAHSRFKIPIDEDTSFTCNISKQSSAAELLKQTTLIIWDEASMAKKENIEALNILLQDICGNEELFGGKIIVFGGDFRQVLPVLTNKTQQEAVDASLVSSYIWPHLIKFRLTENMRAQDDPEFADFLLQLGNGSLQKEETSLIEVPHNIVTCFDNQSEYFDHLSHTIFPEMNTSSFHPHIFSERAILTPKNDNVDHINETLITMFRGTSIIYKSFDSVTDDHCNTYPIEFLNTLCPTGMSPHELILKENCPAILLRNLDPPLGLCNGTRLICRRFFKNLIQCEIATGCYKGEQVFLPRITLKPPSMKYPFNFQRRQFPIKLCFAMTINKAQGQTLEQVAICLHQPCFSHGQLYVALSRAKKRSDVKVFTTPSSEQQSNKELVRNVVSFEMLKRAKII